jgi:hypothetical protein
MTALLFSSTAVSAGDKENSVLSAFFNTLFRNGSDFVVEVKMIGRLLDSITNIEGTLKYKDPGLIRADYVRETGRTTMVLNLNQGTGFYYIHDADMLIRFKAKKSLEPMGNDEFKERLMKILTDYPLELGFNIDKPVLTGVINEMPGFRLFFSPKFKGLERFVRYNETGETAFFISFDQFKSGKAKVEEFQMPKAKNVVDMKEDASTPFDFL